jgi:rRNA biogenesis protein RRP5
VLSYSYVDGLANVTMKQSQLDEPFLRYEDLQVGSVVAGKIAAVHQKGVEIKLTSTIKAFCPRIHLADSVVSDPESRFKVGSEVSCRVLAVDPQARRATVTLKKSLVNTSDIDMLASYADASPDSITRGFIIAVKDFGCIVGFLNNVRGKVPLKELSTAYVADPTKLFQIGQVVKCRVLSADPAKEKLTLSFNLAKSKSQAENDHIQKEIDDFASENRIVTGEITGLSTRGVDVKLTDDLSGFIPLIHLSDHRLHCPLVKKHLKVGQSVDVLVIKKGKAKEAKKVTLSMKPALMAAYKEKKVPTSFSDVTKGSVYVGFVKKILPYGVFVTFGDGVTGLAHKNGLADQFVQNPEEFFYVGQTVQALVVDVYPDRSEFTVSLKQSSANSKQNTFLETFISEVELYGKKKDGVDFSKYQVGSVLSLKTVRQADYGLILETSDANKLTCVAVSQHVPKSLSVEAGTATKGVVLDVDFSKGILDVSLRQDLVRAASASATQSASKLAREAQSLTCTVELIKANYVVLSVRSLFGTILPFFECDE